MYSPQTSEHFVSGPDLVSVIIPTYNRVKSVQESIESVRKQTWTQTEIIVVDDGSTDETQQELEAIADIVYIRQTNSGPAAARNRGLHHANGALICSLDSDDLWQVNFLEHSVNAIRKLDVDLVFSNWTRQNPDGTLVESFLETNHEWWNFEIAEIPHWRIIEPEVIRKTLLDDCIAPTSAWMFRRKLLGKGWTESIKITDDWGLLQDLVLSQPCRVGVNMQRSWLKRVQTDNICDLDGMLVRRAIEIDSHKRVLNTHLNRLTRKEKAHLYRRLAVNLHNLSTATGHHQENARALERDFFSALIAGFAHAPIEFIEKMIFRSFYTPPKPPQKAVAEEMHLEEPLAKALAYHPRVVHSPKSAG